MRTLKSILLIAVMVLAIPSVYSQEVAPNAPVNPNAPQMNFKKIVHDFGTILEGGNGICDFSFTNTGKEPLIVVSVKSSCGCTIADSPQKPILPGKSDVIKVKYDTQRQGPINRTITIVSNAKNSPVVLSIKGNVVPKDTNTLPEKKLSATGAPVAK